METPLGLAEFDPPAQRSADLARRARLGPAHGRRALRAASRERPGRAARQPGAGAHPRRAGARRRRGAARPHPRQRDIDRCRPRHRMGRLPRRGRAPPGPRAAAPAACRATTTSNNRRPGEPGAARAPRRRRADAARDARPLRPRRAAGRACARARPPRRGGPGPTLREALDPHADAIRRFADRGDLRSARRLSRLWDDMFPMVAPPATSDGLGVVLLNSNAEASFSFTNALGLVSHEQARADDRGPSAPGPTPAGSWRFAPSRSSELFPGVRSFASRVAHRALSTAAPSWPAGGRTPSGIRGHARPPPFSTGSGVPPGPVRLCLCALAG